MIKCVLVKLNGDTFDITNTIVNYSFCGRVSGGAREMTITFLNTFTINAGDTIGFTDDNYNFCGQAIEPSKANKQSTQTINFIDYVLHMENSEDTMVINSTPEAVASSICNKLGMAIGSIASTGIATGDLVYESTTYYDIIKELYDMASSKNGKKYYIGMVGAYFYVKEKETIDYIIGDQINLEKIEYSESIRNVVNKVLVYNDKHELIKQKEIANLHTMGAFQKVANEKDNIDKILQDTEYKLIVSGIGDNRCQSGRFIKFVDSESGITGLYEIIEDHHEVNDTIHTMNLTLNFRGING